MTFSNDRERAVFYKKILDAFEGNILVLNPQGLIIYANQYSIDRVALSEEELYERTIYQMEKDGYIINSSTKKVLETGKRAVTFVTGDLKSPLISIANPIFREDGTLEMAASFSLHDDPEGINFEVLEEEKIRALQLAKYSEETPADVIATSPATRSLLQILDHVAPTDTTVLLTGESGCGKEVFAHYLHMHSNRNTNPFIPVNCAAIPESLMESELFGYAPGAFTGAMKRGKIGLFELADNGTLFLDEIGELPLIMQSKLLRAVETGWINRVGDEKPRKINTRIVAATNRNLKDLVRQHKFREDLYYRLNTVELSIPPLRERKEDIVPLALFFLKEYNEKYQTKKVFSGAAIQSFLHYPFPGNVRELRNTVERMVVTSSDVTRILQPVLQYEAADDEPNEHITTQFPDERELDSHPVRDMSLPLKEYLRACEKSYIESVYKLHGKDAGKTARALDIEKSGLYKKLKMYGLR